MSGCRQTADATARDDRAALMDLMLRALETDRRTAEVLASSAATLERDRIVQELKRRRRWFL